MSILIVLTFDDPDEAGKVRKTLRSGEKHHLFSLDDSAIVVKDEDGQVHIKNELDRGVKVGIAGGGLLGLWIGGFIFGGPIGSMLLGAAGGALVGSSTKKGGAEKICTRGVGSN